MELGVSGDIQPEKGRTLGKRSPRRSAALPLEAGEALAAVGAELVDALAAVLRRFAGRERRALVLVDGGDEVRVRGRARDRDSEPADVLGVGRRCSSSLVSSLASILPALLSPQKRTCNCKFASAASRPQNIFRRKRSDRYSDLFRARRDLPLVYFQFRNSLMCHSRYATFL